MPSSELDQAAERLRMFATSTTLAERCIIYALDNPSGDYMKIRTSDRIDELVRCDRRTLADAYLAGQHPPTEDLIDACHELIRIVLRHDDHTDEQIVADMVAYLSSCGIGQSPDLARLLDWIRDDNRKSPELAFTSGEARQIADLWLMQQRGERELMGLEWEEVNQRHWRAVTVFGTYEVHEGASRWWVFGSSEAHIIKSAEDGFEQAFTDYRHRVAGLYVGGTPS